ncbi:9307_t:CDS:2, partial [Dentiscutata erythropus]
NDIMINIEEENPEDQHATIQQMLEVLLEDFVQECDQSEDSSSDDNHSDESTSEREFQLKNPKR